MPRIQPIDPATATGDTAAHLDTSRKMFGGTPNLVTTAAHSSAALGAMLSLFANVGKSSLGAKTGELIAIAVAQSNGCRYCLAAHTAIGGSVGLSGAALADARAAGVTDAEMVEVVAHVALNVFTNYLNNVADTAVDFPEVPFAAAA